MDVKKQSTRKEYQRRINRVVDHIDAHYGEALSLQRLAGVAPFSPYHFHRVFSAVMGETLHAYLRRIRLQKGANRLLHESEPSITAIALECGFSSSSVFAREFKQRFGRSPSAFAQHTEATLTRPGEASAEPPKPAERDPDAARLATIEVRTRVPTRIAYVRRLGAYDQGVAEASARLMTWAGPRRLLGPDTQILGITHDNPHVTEPDRCRFDAAISLAKDVNATGDVSLTTFAPGACAVLPFDGPGRDFEGAYHTLYVDWLPHSGYLPADHPAFFQLTAPPSSLTERITCDLCLPVAPL